MRVVELSAKTENQVAAPTVTTMDAVFHRYVERIYQFLYRRVGNREDAEDLTSEVFLKASRELDIGRSEVSIASWLFTVARTVLTDHWRRYYRHGPVLPFDDEWARGAPDDTDTDSSSIGAEDQLERILAALPERYRRVLELRFLSGLTIRETAQEMGVTPENVKVLQHRALARAVNQSSTLQAGDVARPSANEVQQRPSEPSRLRP